MVQQASKKKSAVKKSAVKKSAVKKSAVKKSAVKKSAVKKSAVKKSAVKKSAVKKSATPRTLVPQTVVPTQPSPQPRSRRSSNVLVKTGRGLIAIGVLVGGFLAYQLWGTSVYETSAQRALEEQFSSDSTISPTSSTLSPTDTQVLPADDPSNADAFVPGGTVKTQALPIARLKIPAIGLDQFVVSGVSWKALKKGPGLFPHSPLPGQAGNAAIAGHRTTFGAPFGRLDELKVGDEIDIETNEGKFTYKVSWTKIIRPNNMSVLKDDPNVKSSLTLITCHPKFSSKKRLVVRANIAPSSIEAVQPATPIVTLGSDAVTEFSFSAGWFHDTGGVLPTVLLGLLLFVLYHLPWFIRRRPHSELLLGVSAFACLILVVPTLWYFYENLARLVPTNM